MTTNTALITRSNIGRIICCNAHAGRASWIKNDRPQALAAAMLRDEDLRAARIPFDGFYHSFLTAAFGEGVERELEWRLENADSNICSLTAKELEYCASGCTIDREDVLEIARAWTSRYEDYLSDAANDLADENDQQDQIRLRGTVYNAEANAAGYWPWGDEERPVAYISKANLRRLRKLAANASAGYHEDICETCDFAGYVRERFTPASGWAPFYSADVREWGPVTTWRAAQIGVLLDFICPDRRLTEYGLDDQLAEAIDVLASAALAKRITEFCCEDAA